MAYSVKEVAEYTPLFLLGILSFLFYQIKRFDYLFIAGLLLSIIGAGYFVYAVVKIISELRQGRIPVTEIPLLFVPFIGYAIMKYSFYGIPVESMGAKGLIPTLIRLGMILVGTSSSPAQILGVWVGFAAMALGVIGAIHTILDYIGGRISLDYAKKIGYVIGISIVGGFITAHLAQTGFMFPITILSIEGYVTVSYIPLYVIGLILSLIGIFYLLQYLFAR